jgi:7-keto-8-aminopelargonate synthetase-like enzyme
MMPLKKNFLHFSRIRGKHLEERVAPFREWLEARRTVGLMPFGRSLTTSTTNIVRARSEAGSDLPTPMLNFCTQDYLGLANDPRVLEAAKAAIYSLGVHSAASPLLFGRQTESLALEAALCKLFEREACIIYPTGWAAGYSFAGLATDKDTIIIDSFAHNCLQAGSKSATADVVLFKHNDMVDLRKKLEQARLRNPDNGIFVVAETLYSMDADCPDLARFVRVSQEFEAITVIDIAHDFGALGQRGFGLLEDIDRSEWPDIILGSFTKTFASNGGFIVCTRAVRDFLFFHSAPLMFSNNISPVQAATARIALEIAFSQEGQELRSAMLANARALREKLEHSGLTVLGKPSGIVPLLIGDEAVSRLTAKLLEREGLAVNLSEFPAVPIRQARIRFQIRPQHTEQMLLQAFTASTRAYQEAVQIMSSTYRARIES